MTAGRRVKQTGCHVRIKPKDLQKLQVWVLILDLKFSGWGAKRIAAHLNEMSIPSPDAGRTRTDNNTVDAEALLELILCFFRQQVIMRGDRDRVRQKLLELADNLLGGGPEEDRARELCRLKSESEVLQKRIQQAGENYSLATEEFLRGLAAENVRKFKTEFDRIQDHIRQMEEPSITLGVDAQVDAAMSLFDQIKLVLRDPNARHDLVKIFSAMNLRVGLSFTDAIKGKVKKVRRLVGGTIVLGGAQLPIPLHGKDAISPDEECHSAASSGNILNESERPADSRNVKADSDDDFPSSESAQTNPLCRHEGVSFTKVSRGEALSALPQMLVFSAADARAAMTAAA